MTQRTAPGFTGRHMTLILVGFFAVVIAVNLLMARFAVGTFGGTVVANSYVASQHYNDWLEEGRRQAALGWQVQLSRDAAGRLQLVARDRAGQMLDGATATAVAEHPLGQKAAQKLSFAGSPALLTSNAALPAGRWRVRLQINVGDQQLQQVHDLP